MRAFDPSSIYSSRLILYLNRRSFLIAHIILQELGGEEWERTVKWYSVDGGLVLETMEIEEDVDFACGPVTSRYRDS